MKFLKVSAILTLFVFTFSSLNMAAPVKSSNLSTYVVNHELKLKQLYLSIENFIFGNQKQSPELSLDPQFMSYITKQGNEIDQQWIKIQQHQNQYQKAPTIAAKENGFVIQYQGGSTFEFQVSPKDSLTISPEYLLLKYLQYQNDIEAKIVTERLPVYTSEPFTLFVGMIILGIIAVRATLGSKTKREAEMDFVDNELKERIRLADENLKDLKVIREKAKAEKERLESQGWFNRIMKRKKVKAARREAEATNYLYRQAQGEFRDALREAQRQGQKKGVAQRTINRILNKHADQDAFVKRHLKKGTITSKHLAKIDRPADDGITNRLFTLVKAVAGNSSMTKRERRKIKRQIEYEMSDYSPRVQQRIRSLMAATEKAGNYKSEKRYYERSKSHSRSLSKKLFGGSKKDPNEVISPKQADEEALEALKAAGYPVNEYLDNEGWGPKEYPFRFLRNNSEEPDSMRTREEFQEELAIALSRAESFSGYFERDKTNYSIFQRFLSIFHLNKTGYFSDLTIEGQQTPRNQRGQMVFDHPDFEGAGQTRKLKVGKEFSGVDPERELELMLKKYTPKQINAAKDFIDYAGGIEDAIKLAEYNKGTQKGLKGLTGEAEDDYTSLIGSGLLFSFDHLQSYLVGDFELRSSLGFALDNFSIENKTLDTIQLDLQGMLALENKRRYFGPFVSMSDGVSLKLTEDKNNTPFDLYSGEIKIAHFLTPTISESEYGYQFGQEETNNIRDLVRSMWVKKNDLFEYVYTVENFHRDPLVKQDIEEIFGTEKLNAYHEHQLDSFGISFREYDRAIEEILHFPLDYWMTEGLQGIETREALEDLLSSRKFLIQHQRMFQKGLKLLGDSLKQNQVDPETGDALPGISEDSWEALQTALMQVLGKKQGYQNASKLITRISQRSALLSEKPAIENSHLIILPSEFNKNSFQTLRSA